MGFLRKMHNRAGTTSVRNILVVNFHSSLNAGDLALLQTCINLLRSEFPNATFVVSSNFPEEGKLKSVADQVVPSPWRLAGGNTNRKTRFLILNLFFGWLLAATRIYSWGFWRNIKWKTLFEAYQKSDIVAAVSGNQFFSSGRYGWPILAIALSLFLADIFHKPLYIMPQSIGPLRYKFERVLLRKSYSKARKIYLRDYQSLLLAKAVKLPNSRTFFIPDPAFVLKPAMITEAQEILQKYGYHSGIQTIGVTVIASMPSYLDQELVSNYYLSIAQALSYMAEKYQFHVFFFNQVIGPSKHEDDRIATYTVVRQMTINREQVHIVEEFLDPSKLKACYGFMGLFLASRLHSGIFSFAMGVPTVFIGYLSKTRGVLEAINQQQNMVELENLTTSQLISILERMWLQEENQRIVIPNVIKGIEEQIISSIRSISDDFKA